jgi:indolepyruvate ferredoxin oxidoreductase
LLGVALQAGHIPVSVDAITEAIELNGVAVDANLVALDWGRRWVEEPDTVAKRAEQVAANPPTTMMRVAELTGSLQTRAQKLDDAIGPQDAPGYPDGMALVTILASDLADYQNRKYAERYLDTVEVAARAERRAAPGSMAFVVAVAKHLHKLMAYKDEYEVARLMLSSEAAATVASVGGPDAKFTWRLHPPMLKALGMDDKIPVGSWAKPAIAALAAGKRLRGTRLDPFGRTHMRQLERALVSEYIDAVMTVADALTAEHIDAAAHLAQLPDLVRGFEELKLNRVETYRHQLQAALGPFSQG